IHPSGPPSRIGTLTSQLDAEMIDNGWEMTRRKSQGRGSPASVPGNRLPFLFVIALVTGCVEPRNTPFDAQAERTTEGPEVGQGVQDGGSGDAPASTPSDVDGGADALDESSRDADEASVSSPDAPRGTREQGAICANAAECVSGNCVEGVCCDDSCNGKCNSCLFANTGQSSGQCAPVKAGFEHGKDCTASDPSTCGFDGKCDGAGSCRFAAAAIPCQGESCVLEMYSVGGTCDGAGTCKTQPRSSCGNYACTSDRVRCWSTCGTDAECASSAFCASSSCVTKLPSGKVCERAAQCASGACGGRCCNVGTSCKCTQPSPSNLIKNPGFDGDLSAWVVTQGTWNTADADGCPFSGSLSIPDNPSSLNGFAQCVPVIGNKAYNFGGWFKGPNALNSCDVQFGDAPDCVGNGMSDLALPNSTVLSADTWTELSVSGFAPSAAKTAYVVCFAFGLLVDHVYLSPAPGQY
ncbi:MAG: Flagellar hook-length control protein FliK, partial [Myxococcales bacterium]|nr:Flagellar hook-length control protein FliK [Myxococcales bacterium]